MEAGKRIRALREGRSVKPSEIERITQSMADAKRNADFYVSLSALAEIEAGSVPSIHKLFGLAVSLRVSLDELLLSYGIDPREVTGHTGDRHSDASSPQLPAVRDPAFRFQLTFDTNFNKQETTLVKFEPEDLANLPWVFQARLDPARYRYAIVGTKDDSMADLLPPRSLVEIDTVQSAVEVFAWQTLRDRPVYLVGHRGGHTCAWCQVDGIELTVLPHPLSRQPVRRFRMPTEAVVVGRVTTAWAPFEPLHFRSGDL